MPQRPIPQATSIAETCFTESWPLARAIAVAEASGQVDRDVLTTCQFNDHSKVHYGPDGSIFGIELIYDVRGGVLISPQMDEQYVLAADNTFERITPQSN